ncbi:alpha/beta hydrolase family protein [Lysobacter sp. GX 14042]|uniref:alpha/beta hydrolase n=1 Tax=Lysobacter sp. GX 14042 TaxID=2907155 RepID=UPI001F2AFEEB|nr:alpha/beta hydrolase [Lysobacter sp. GX 14042]MCE7031118.1 alpha/beta hydrolase family protein [Lysobacter sp. GX 14042]
MTGPVSFESQSLQQLSAWTSAPPPDGMDAAATMQWWNGLSGAEQQVHLYGQPSALGGMEGLPAEVRHEANLQVLRGDAAAGSQPQEAQALLDRIEQSWNGPEGERIHLLDYQPPGRDGQDAKVVASIGNPDHADNVAVYVPGTGSDLGNFGGSLDRADALRAQSEMVPGSGDTVTIAWLGYDAPDHIPAAVLPGYALDGAPELQSFTQGLRETNSDARVTVIGHSYGSTVVGTADALDGGLGVDDIIALGSPGMGYEQPSNVGFLFDDITIGDVGEMNIDADHFWAGANSNDVVTYTQAHGNSPVDWSFGGQRIATGDLSGHSSYWDNGSESMRNQAYIITGNHEQVTTERRRFG